MAITKDAFVASLTKSFAQASTGMSPYKHWNLTNCLPDDAVDPLLDLPFPAPALGGVSGKREIHNATRRYFDAENNGRYQVCKVFCEAFQDPRVVDAVTNTFGANIKGSFLRVEYAQDTDGFWLEPHTDLGVKTFTMLLYMSRDPSHSNLGTDIYDTEKKHVGRSPFSPNSAMIFVPSNITYHGFEPRKINGVRKSIIINYVTNDWRAREQLAYPNTPV